MVNDPTISHILTNINASVRLVLQERDRLNSLYDGTLPNNGTVWSFLPTDVQNDLKTQIVTNLTQAASDLNDIVTEYSNTNQQP